MADVIQCPTCSKRYKLPDRPPATFTCSACNTVMDLSAFRQAAPIVAAVPAPAPAPAAPSAPASGTRSSSGRSGRSGSGSGRAGRSSRPGAAAARVRHARAGRGEGGEDEDGGRLPPPKKNNSMLIAAAIGFVVILGVALVVMNNKKRSDEAAKEASAKAAEKLANEKKAAEAAALAPPTGAMTDETAGMEGEAPPPKKPVTGGLHVVDFPDDVSADDRKRIDDLVQKAVFENAGSDSVAAGKELVAMGVKAAPRLINVFHTVKIGEGYDSRMGKMQAGVADGLLRKIDGYMERHKPSMTQIKATSDPRFAESTAKTWTSWWDNELYKKPEKPWDPRIDGNPEGGGMADSGMEDPGMLVGEPAMDAEGMAPDTPPDGK